MDKPHNHRHVRLNCDDYVRYITAAWELPLSGEIESHSIPQTHTSQPGTIIVSPEIKSFAFIDVATV
jgi:hypothetical protein